MANYLSTKEVIYLHHNIVKRDGGVHGVQNLSLLESALARPKAGFGNFEAYPDIFAKASALFHALIKNHPFIDGNKRTALIVCGIFLRRNGYRLAATNHQLINLVLNTATDKITEPVIADWLKKHTRETETKR